MYAFGHFAVDTERRLLTRDGHPVPITARAFDVLLALLRRTGDTVGKDELLRLVWPDTFVEEANLSQQIFTLRKILGQTDEHVYIATVPRRGYRWVAPLRNAAHTGGRNTPITAAAVDVPRVARLDIVLDSVMVLGDAASVTVAISRDGRFIVYVGSDGTTTRLYLRPIAQFEAVPISGSEGARNPFFSPDGQWIGYQCGRRLVKVALEGGSPLALCDVADVRGATWTERGDIVYAPGPTTGLWRVSAWGGTATALTTLNFERGERTHRWPHALPDGQVIFTVGNAGATSFDEATLAMTRTGTSEHQTVLQHASDGRWLAENGLIWARGGTLFAAPFDLVRGRLSDAPRIVQQGVATSATGVAHFACAQDGTLVHVPGEAQTLRRSLVSVDRQGVEIARHTSGEALEEPRVSPYGRAVIMSLRSRTSDLWLHDFGSGATTRLTFDGENFAGIWGPEHDTITYSASYGGASDLFLLRRNQEGAPELLVSSDFDKVAGAWSADGQTLVFTQYHPDTGADIWLLDRVSQRLRPFVTTRFNEYAPVFSPDGRYLAYVTDESGRPEVVAVPYPEAIGKRQLSTEGGTEPIWSRDGAELFYRNGNRVMHVDISRGIAEAGIPTTLFEGRYVHATVTLANYDQSIDSSRFFMVAAEVPPSPRALRVTLGCSAAHLR